MRAEDKQLEGQDLEREQRVEASRAHAAEELPAFAGEEVRDVALDHRSRVLEAVQLVLAGEQLDLTLLYLPQRETHALEALRTAVGGRDNLGEFVFAEDRRSLLEQALAVLQQNLTHGDPSQRATLQHDFEALTARVGELRATLADLEDAQEDREEFHQAAKPGAAGETDAAAQPKPGAQDAAATNTSLDGPERPPPAKAPSTLTGPERAAAPRPRSTLRDGEPAEASADPSPPVSTLGDPAELAEAAAKLPWWKKLRG